MRMAWLNRVLCRFKHNCSNISPQKYGCLVSGRLHFGNAAFQGSCHEICFFGFLIYSFSSFSEALDESKGVELAHICMKEQVVFAVNEEMHIYLFVYNNFICYNKCKKAAIREELNPRVN